MKKIGYASVVMVILAVAILGACAGPGSFAKDAYYGESAPAFEGRAVERDAIAGSAPAPASSSVATTGDFAPGGQPRIVDQPEERLRVYSADLDLGVASVEHARNAVIDLAQSSGGYVESSQETFVVIRIPAGSFDRILEEIEAIGTVRSRAIRTADVTDQFFDLERRLEIAVAARDRLNLLLKQTDDADERVAILREIRRLTEEIERLRASFDSLAQLIAYSRISVRLTPLITEVSASRSRIPFSWIARLAPLTQTTSDASFRIPVEIPASFAIFSEGLFVGAEAADGTKIRIGAVANDPVGDNQFWARALEYHLGPYYQRVTGIDVGSFGGVMLESKDTEPYYYAVAVAVVGGDESGAAAGEVIVVEVFYPNVDSLENRSDSIVHMLEEVEL